jgi:hypothetical protein
LRGAFLNQAADSAVTRDDDNDDDAVQVYDNTFSSVPCQVIHALATQHAFAVNGETTFFRRHGGAVLHQKEQHGSSSSMLSPLEHVIDSVLTAFNDTTPLVEYWYRDEYMNMYAHVDIDEQRLEQYGQLAVPLHSHVLYLDVNNNNMPYNAGPTCIFPSQHVGWNVSTATQSQAVDLVICPCVPARILRFVGSAMHSVPYPPDRWMQTVEQELHQQKQEQEEDMEEDSESLDDWDDDDDEENGKDEDECVRSVLLFNTWSDEDGPGPLASASHLQTTRPSTAQLTDWEEDYGVHAELIRCNPSSVWCKRPVEETTKAISSAQSQQLRVGLMGEQNRRLYPDNFALLDGPSVHEMRAALYEESKVTKFRLNRRD